VYSGSYLLFFEIGNSSIPFQDIMHVILFVVLLYYLFNRRQFRLRLYKSSGCVGVGFKSTTPDFAIAQIRGIMSVHKFKKD
jgi:hypothetical protein